MFGKLVASHVSDKTHNFGDVSVMRGGRRWKGGYRTQGGKLLVSSAWGSRSEQTSRTTGELNKRAAVILGEIVDARQLELEGA